MVMEGIFFSCKIEPQFDDHEDGDEEACHSDIVKLYDITYIKFVYILFRMFLQPCGYLQRTANRDLFSQFFNMNFQFWAFWGSQGSRGK